MMNLNLVFDEIVKSNLVTKVNVLVGDNASQDDTPRICDQALEIALRLGINFECFRNESNLGFRGNIEAGYKRVKSGFLMFLSDDDTILIGSLARVCEDLELVQPSVALYNFDQEPFTSDHLLVAKTDIFTAPIDLSAFSTLLVWPKLTGIVVKASGDRALPADIHSVLKASTHFAHVILCLALLRDGGMLLKSETFVAKVDEDYLEHVNFVPYISEYLIMELLNYGESMENQHDSFHELVNRIPRINIIDSSTSLLMAYYKGNRKLTRQVRKELWGNIANHVFRKRPTSSRLDPAPPTDRFYFKFFVLLILFIASFTVFPIIGRKPQLMSDGF
jgi:glycosyltransferase involved in cell wall biosynthesis